MSQGENTPGISKLAGVMDAIVKKNHDGNLIIDYGIINDDLSISTNTFPIPIPKKDYMCCRHLKEIPVKDRWNTEPATVGDHGSHSHRFQPHWKLKKGDRVLVAWVQNDPVVIDVLVHADEVF